MKEIKKHMKPMKSDPAMEVRLSHEDEFQKPRLEQIYWENPNSCHGTISRLVRDDQIRVEVHSREGI